MRIWLNHFGWRPTLEYYGIVGIVLGIILFLVIRNAPSEEKKNQTKENFHSSDFFLNLKIVSKNRRSWIIAFVAAFFYVTTSTFGALWGVPFLHTKYGIQIDTAGFIISLIYVGWIVVGPVIGHFSKNIEQKLLFLLFGSALAFFLISIIIYVPGIPLGVVGILLFLVGGISSAQLLCFSYAMLINPDEVKATASALTNCLSKGLAALMQTFVGFLLDFNWGGQMEAGARIYSTKAYTIAMTTFPITFFIAFLLTLFLKRAQNQTQIGGNI